MQLLDIFINLPESTSPWWANPKDIVMMILSIGALSFSIFSFQRNRRLSIQQAVLKMSLDKAKDCNNLWTVAYDNAKRLFGAQWTYKALVDWVPPPTPENVAAIDKIQDVVSELTISKEILKKSFELFRAKFFLKSYFPRSEEIKYAYVFWKQLNTSLRDYFVTTAIPVALKNAEIIKIINDNRGEKPKIDSPFAAQVHDVYFFVEDALEQTIKQEEIERLKVLVAEMRLRLEDN